MAPETLPQAGNRDATAGDDTLLAPAGGDTPLAQEQEILPEQQQRLPGEGISVQEVAQQSLSAQVSEEPSPRAQLAQLRAQDRAVLLLSLRGYPPAGLREGPQLARHDEQHVGYCLGDAARTDYRDRAGRGGKDRAGAAAGHGLPHPLPAAGAAGVAAGTGVTSAATGDAGPADATCAANAAGDADPAACAADAAGDANPAGANAGANAGTDAGNDATAADGATAAGSDAAVPTHAVTAFAAPVGN